MRKKESKETWKFWLEIGAFVISIIALLISWQSSTKANKISEQANQAKIVLLDTIDIQRGNSQDLRQYLCRARIRVVNIGGAKTSVVSAGYNVQMSNTVEYFEISDNGKPGYLDDGSNNGITLIGYTWDVANAPSVDDILSESIPDTNSFKLPYEVSENNTVDFFSDIRIKVDPQKFRFLVGWLLPQQSANSSYSENFIDDPHISVEFSLIFSNGNKVTTPALACFIFEQ